MEQLYLGDCLDILPTLKDKSIDHILTDIPYGTTACKWDSIIPFEPMWKELKRIIKDNGCIALFGTEPFSSYLRISNIELFKYDWVWNKKRISNPLLAKKQPLRNIELISVFYNKQATYNPQPTLKSTGKGLSQKLHNLKHNIETTNSKYIVDRNLPTIGYPKVLLDHIKVINNLSKDKTGLHPTQKPIELCEYLIKTYTNEKETVLDFTMGSGTTGVACVNTNRNFIGIEKDKKYYELASKRIGA